VQGHAGAIHSGFSLLGQAPFGRGLGTTGTIGQRVFGSAAITTENWFLAIALELGVVPSLLFIASSIGVAIEAYISFRRVRDESLRRIALVVLGGSLGFFVLGNMLSVWEVPVISMAFWLLAGIAVGARETEADPEYRASP
jgi:ABC-type transporter Mla maintaining outer membrane lipid asymmetry permease subunit MlaE